MYIKFLIGSIIFALVCFGIGYRVCWLRMDKKVKEMETWNRRVERNYDSLLERYKEQVAMIGMACNNRKVGALDE